MKPLRLAVLGLVAYAAFLVATMPASVVAARVADATRGRVTLANATGSAWDGSGRLRVALPGAALAIDEARWRWLPSRLLAGRIAFAVQARGPGLAATGEVSRSPLAWQASGVTLTGEAGALGTLVPAVAAWQPAGAIAVEAASLEWDGERASGTATLEWRDAALALSAVRPLGTWRLEATGDGPALQVALATVKGPLRLAGKGRVALPGRLAFSGEARAEAGRERDLEPLLDLVGPRRADGARAIEIR